MCAMAVQNANESRDHICKDGSETLTLSVPMPSMATYARMTLCNRAHKREISDVDVGTIFSLSCEYHMGSLSVVDWPDRSICCHRFCISFSSILFCLFFSLLQTTRFSFQQPWNLPFKFRVITISMDLRKGRALVSTAQGKQCTKYSHVLSLLAF